jgi:hypothetical protein
MSSKADKRKKALRAYAKKRARRPAGTVAERVSLKANHRLEQRMIRDHIDVLQNVEFSLVRTANESDQIDDLVVERILRDAIKYESSEDPIVRWGLDLLATVRQQRPDVADDLWRDALRVVYTSLTRHSSCQPGDTNYLRFVSRYVG